MPGTGIHVATAGLRTGPYLSTVLCVRLLPGFDLCLVVPQHVNSSKAEQRDSANSFYLFCNTVLSLSLSQNDKWTNESQCISSTSLFPFRVNFGSHNTEVGASRNGKCLDPWVTGWESALAKLKLTSQEWAINPVVQGHQAFKEYLLCSITYLILIKATMGQLTIIASSMCIDMGTSLEMLSIKERVVKQ